MTSRACYILYGQSQRQKNLFCKAREENIYKRPRGLDALLGHLLVKRIPVTFQLTSTKIPEYLSQK